MIVQVIQRPWAVLRGSQQMALLLGRRGSTYLVHPERHDCEEQASLARRVRRSNAVLTE